MAALRAYSTPAPKGAIFKFCNSNDLPTVGGEYNVLVNLLSFSKMEGLLIHLIAALDTEYASLDLEFG
jgi:hypothetical protein